MSSGNLDWESIPLDEIKVVELGEFAPIDLPPLSIESKEYFTRVQAQLVEIAEKLLSTANLGSELALALVQEIENSSSVDGKLDKEKLLGSIDDILDASSLSKEFSKLLKSNILCASREVSDAILGELKRLAKARVLPRK